MQGRIDTPTLSTLGRPRLLTPAEVGRLFRVGPKTVSNWARKGKLTAVVTPGGQRRFRSDEVRALLAAREEVRGDDSGSHDDSAGPFR